jgi:hypothetical protein
MTNVFESGQTWLNTMRNSYASEAVVYTRGATDYAINATAGRTEYESENHQGIKTIAQAYDFMILASSLGIDPAAGDVITWNGRKYEVMKLGVEGCWRWSDTQRTTYRIHTKDIGAAS